MKQLILCLCAVATLGAHAADLSIEVSTPAGKPGVVLAALFDRADGFPRGKPLQTATATPVNGKAVVVFTGLPEGDYAATAFLDEYANMKLDSNLFGLPTELYGFSRNARNPVGPPPFADAAFRLGAGNAQHALELK